MTTRDRTNFSQDVQFARSVKKFWMLDRFQWEAVQLLLAKVIIVFDLLDRCGIELYCEDGQVTGLRHTGTGVVYKPHQVDQ